jgi:hypothetical protein
MAFPVSEYTANRGAQSGETAPPPAAEGGNRQPLKLQHCNRFQKEIKLAFPHSPGLVQIARQLEPRRLIEARVDRDFTGVMVERS